MFFFQLLLFVYLLTTTYYYIFRLDDESMTGNERRAAGPDDATCIVWAFGMFLRWAVTRNGGTFGTFFFTTFTFFKYTNYVLPCFTTTRPRRMPSWAGRWQPTTEVGPDDATRIVWAFGMFF